MSIRDDIKKFLSKFIGDKVIEDTDNIFEQGLVNSLFAMQLVSFIENEYGIALGNDDLELDNFKDIDSITKLITSKQQ